MPLRDGSPRGRGVAVLSLGVRSGPEHVVTLWMVRSTSDFSARDRALLAMLAPALERLLRGHRATTLAPTLTAQERRVLHHVARGMSNAEIAARLVVAPCTVRKHLENAYRKLGVTNRVAAVNALEGGRPADDLDDLDGRRLVSAAEGR
jgi:DNA-binding NarL/FixJ family response regulator